MDNGYLGWQNTITPDVPCLVHILSALYWWGNSVEYPFHQLGSTVSSLSPPNFLCTLSLFFGGVHATKIHLSHFSPNISWSECTGYFWSSVWECLMENFVRWKTLKMFNYNSDCTTVYYVYFFGKSQVTKGYLIKTDDLKLTLQTDLLPYPSLMWSYWPVLKIMPDISESSAKALNRFYFTIFLNITWLLRFPT